MFFASNVSSKAQCTGNESHVTHTFTFGGCDYTVELCIDCNPAVYTGVRIVSVHFDISQSNCVPPGSTMFWDMIHAELSDPNLYWTILCQSVWGTRPCPDYYTFRVYWNYCWYTEFSVVDDIREQFFYPCDDVTCEEEFQTCYNTQTQQYKKTTVGIDGPSGTVQCSYFYHQITIPTEDDVPSECFLRQSSMACPIE